MKVLKFKEYSKINEELSKSSILAGLMSLIFGYSSAQKQIDINFNQQTILKNSIKLDSNSIQKLFNTIKKAYPKISVDTIKMTNPSEIEISRPVLRSRWPLRRIGFRSPRVLLPVFHPGG